MLKGKKTALVSLILMIVGAVQGFDWATIVSDPTTVGWIGTGIGAIMFVLRAITNSPMLESE